jgi:hypothetical protein
MYVYIYIYIYKERRTKFLLKPTQTPLLINLSLSRLSVVRIAVVASLFSFHARKSRSPLQLKRVTECKRWRVQLAQQIISGKAATRRQLAQLWQLFVHRDVNAVASKLRVAVPIYLGYFRMAMRAVIVLLTLRHAVFFTKISGRSPFLWRLCSFKSLAVKKEPLESSR